MKQGFPKAARLITKSDYKRIIREGKRFFSPSLIIEFRYGGHPQPRLGITVSRKCGKAHVRNKFKRILRETFRTSRPLLPSQIELHVKPKGKFAEDPSKKTSEEFRQFLNNLS